MQDLPPPVQPQNPVVAPVTKTTVAQADSEKMEVDEGEDTIDKAIAGEKKEEGYESSDIELSSDEEEDEESSDSSSEEDEEEDSDAEDGTPKEKGKKPEVMDDEEEVFTDGIVKTVNEIVDIVVEKPTFNVTPQTEIVLAGSVFQIIGNVVVIHCRPGCEYSTLDQGSLLVYENREILGEVFETFGPVARPYYSVRFNDAKEINTEYGKIGAPVYYVPSYQKTQIVETETLRKMKGTDASNIFDEEVGEDEMEFSDDEKEMEFKRKKKNKGKRAKKNAGNANDNGGVMNNNRSSMNRPRPRPPRDAPLDFDQELAAYQGSQMPPRQQQSYADITDYQIPPRQQQSYADITDHVTPPPVPQMQQSGGNYQTPAELVSALFKSYNGKLPTQLPPQQSSKQEEASQSSQTSDKSNKSIQTLFSTPPPSID